ncbi:MAG: hypothetical protein R3E68_00100 [Burkholderiaceae bacterium]
MDKMTPLTALLGFNGSGKSTVFDVFAFLAECFTDGLCKAWDRRGASKSYAAGTRMGRSARDSVSREAPELRLTPIT